MAREQQMMINSRPKYNITVDMVEAHTDEMIRQIAAIGKVKVLAKVKTELCGLEETLKECMDKVSFTTQRYE
jgi:hypothetical protein